MQTLTTSPSGSAASAETSLLSAEQILGANDITYDIVDVPEWGGKVRVRGLTSDEWDAIENSLVVQDGKKQRLDYGSFRAKLVRWGCVDAGGQHLFTSDDAVQKLGKKSAAALSRVAVRIQQLSKVKDSEVEELVGNSSGGRSADSSTS